MGVDARLLQKTHLTMDQAAAEMGVTRQTLSRWIREGKVPAQPAGRQKLIAKEDVLRLQEVTVQFDAIDKAAGGDLRVLFIPKERMILRPGERYRIVLQGLKFEDVEVGRPPQ